MIAHTRAPCAPVAPTTAMIFLLAMMILPSREFDDPDRSTQASREAGAPPVVRRGERERTQAGNS